MAVVIETQAPSIGLSGNQIIWLLRTDQYPQQTGQHSDMLMDLSEGPSVGDQMLIQWNDEEGVKQANFYFVTPGTEDDSGEQVPAYTTGALSVYENDVLLQCMIGHPVISNYFQVSIFSGFIRIRSLLQQEYNITVTAVGFNIPSFQFQNGAGFGIRENYQMMYRVLLKKEKDTEGVYDYSAWQYAVPDTGGRLSVDIAQVIHTLNYNTDSILAIITGYTKLTLTNRGYFIEATERWKVKDTLIQRKAIRSTEKCVIRGGEPQRIFSINIFDPSRVGKWLGLQGLSRMLEFGSAAQMSFVVEQGVLLADSLNMVVNITTSTGSAVITNSLTEGNFKPGDLLSVPVGYNALGLHTIVPEAEVICYTIFIAKNTLNRTDAITDMVEITPVRAKRYHREILYRGAHGTAETLLLNGEQSEATALQYTSVETVRPLPLTKTDHTTQKINTTSIDTLSIATGAYPASYKDVWWEILHSREIYIKEDGQPVAVTLLNSNAVKSALRRDADNLLSAVLEFSYNRD